MKTIIFDTAVMGHHLEYIHHLYDSARRKIDERFLIVVPERFLDLKSRFEWVNAPNIEFAFLTDEEVKKCSSKGYFQSAFHKSRILRKYVLGFHADNVFLITLVHFLPFLPLMLPADTRISGIIYRIFVYEWKNLPFFKKIKDVLETFIMVHSDKIKFLFLLNDNSAVCYYNKVYKTDKFRFLPDPIVTSLYTPKNIRHKYNIGNDKKVFFHFGVMNHRKGSLMILEAIELLSVEELKGMAFIFAGKIDKDIHDEFYLKYDELLYKATIIIIEGFCSYELLTDLCYSSDCVLTPYSNSSFSSGVLGYAASLNKPVIGPENGLLGKLIKRNCLGLTLVDMTPYFLANQLKNIDLYRKRNKNYVVQSTIKLFSSTVFKTIFN